MAMSDAERVARYRARRKLRSAAECIVRRASVAPPGWYIESPLRLTLSTGSEAYTLRLSIPETEALAHRLLMAAARAEVYETDGPATFAFAEGRCESPNFGLHLTGLDMTLAAGEQAYVTYLNRASCKELASSLLAEVIRNEPLVGVRERAPTQGVVFTGEPPPPLTMVHA